MQFLMNTPIVDKNFCSAYFVVGMTHEIERANMELTEEAVPFILASTSKLRISGNEHTVKIPVLVNTSIIKEGDELLYFAKKVEVVKESKPPQALVVRSSKKAKVSHHA